MMRVAFSLSLLAQCDLRTRSSIKSVVGTVSLATGFVLAQVHFVYLTKVSPHGEGQRTTKKKVVLISVVLCR